MYFFSNHASRLEFHQLGFNEIVIWQVDLKYLVDTFFLINSEKGQKARLLTILQALAL